MQSQTTGCKKIFDDKISGSHAERPGLAKVQETLREGDTLVVWKLDRLGRSVKHLVDLVGELHKRGVQFKSLTDAIDTGTASGRSSSMSWPASPKWNGSSSSNGLKRASKSLASSAVPADASGR